MYHDDYSTTSDFANYTKSAHLPSDPYVEAIKTGHQKRLNSMTRRLSAFFRFTREEVRADDPTKPKYAQNRNSSGLLVPVLMTLTYPSNDKWRPEHITAFMDHCRKYAKRKWGENLRYAWVAETTKKGVIHYHVTAWIPRMGKFPKPDEQGWWPHGLSEISSVKKGVYSYLLKYISKGCDMLGLGVDSITKNGKKQAARMFGYGGLPARDREFLSHQMLPHYIKDIFGGIPWGQSIKRVKGGWECGKVFVKSNWEGVWNPETGSMDYKYGVSWMALPDEPLKDIVFPF